MNMTNLIVLMIVILAGVFYFLSKEGWQKRHVFSLVLGLGWAFLFFTYGQKILVDIWPTATASTFFIAYFVLFWGGSALIAIIPLLSDGHKHDALKVFKLFLALGLIYIMIDNIGFGPPAVGPNSPYIGKDLCALNPTFYAEDVAMGCYGVQKFGIDPFGQTASFLVYIIYSLIIFWAGMRLIGFKKAEEIIYGR